MASPITGPDVGSEVSTFPPFDSTFFPSQILWLALCFGALYWLMSQVALPRVATILATRQARIVSDLDEAQAMQARAEDAGRAHEQSLAAAKAQAQEVARTAKERLASQADNKRRALEAELTNKLAAAESQIAETKAKAMQSVAGISRDAAIEIVQKLTGKAPDIVTVDRAMERLSEQAGES